MLQANIVVRLVFLNQINLQQQTLFIRLCDNIVKMVNFTHKLSRLPGMGRLEIRTDTIS